MGILDFEKEVGNRTFQSDNRFKNSLPNGAFEISTQNPDGSKKYSFDTIYKDRELINVARDYYESLYNTEYKEDKDVVDEFIADRTWKQSNIASIASEYVDIKGLNEKQRGNLGYLQNYWNSLPNFYEEGGRGWSKGIWSNLWRGVLDPTNIVSFGVGSVFTKAAAKKIGSTALRQKIKTTTNKELKKKLNKELRILKKQIEEGTYKAPVKKLTAAATIPTVAFDSSLFAAADLLSQKSEKEIGLRDKFDLKRTGQVAIIGGGISVLPNGLFSYAAVRREVEPFTALADKKLIDDEVSKTVSGISGETKTTKKKSTETLADKNTCLLYTSPSPRAQRGSRMPSSA